MPRDPPAEPHDVSSPKVFDGSHLKRHIGCEQLLRTTITLRQAKQQHTVDDRKLETSAAQQTPLYAILTPLDLRRHLELSEAVRALHLVDQLLSHPTPQYPSRLSIVRQVGPCPAMRTNSRHMRPSRRASFASVVDPTTLQSCLAGRARTRTRASQRPLPPIATAPRGRSWKSYRRRSSTSWKLAIAGERERRIDCITEMFAGDWISVQATAPLGRKCFPLLFA